MGFMIGNIEIKNRIVLAPMAGICNSAFRKIIKEMGAGLMYAEMVSDKAIYYNSKKTSDMLYMEECERPIAQQIFGSDKDTFIYAAKEIYEKMKPDIIDINMGCPVPKVALRAQAGSALLKNPDKIYDIVKSVVESVPIPVTVKIRIGWDDEHINAVDVARICEKAGAAAITVHGRTRAQGYSGKVDYEIIRKVKENVSIPVIGNGDIVDIDSAKKMFETGVDAIMIGRGVLGNPWLIRDIVNYFTKGIDPIGVSYKEKIDMCFKHLEYLMEIKPEKVAVMEMRKAIAWYIKGLPNSVDIKVKCFKAITADEIKKILNEYLIELNSSI